MLIMKLIVLFIYRNKLLRVNHPEEIFTIGDKHDLLVITVDKEKLQVGCSIKQLSQTLLKKYLITN